MAPDEGLGSNGADEALRRLEERLDRASDAAERLLGEAADSAARAARSAAGAAGAFAGRAASEDGDPETREPPPAGWQVPRSDDQQSGRSDLELLAQVVQSLRDLIPPELERRLAEALRELLLAVRAVIDWYLERVERRKASPADVQDIPIA